MCTHSEGPVTAPNVSWKAVLASASIAGLLTLPLATWVTELANPWYTIRGPAPAGQSAYLASRLLALYALTLLWLQVLAGLQMHRLLRRWSWEDLLAWHVPQGIAALLFALLHPLLFWFGVYQRTDKTDWLHWIEPTFSHGYYQSMQSFGRIGLLLLIVGTLGAAIGRRMGLSRIALWVHRLNVVTFAMVLWHGHTIGGETRSGPMPALLLIMAATVVIALIDRARHGLRSTPVLVPSQPGSLEPRRISRALVKLQAAILFVALLPVGMNLAGFGDEKVAMLPSPEIARGLLAERGVKVIDIREPEEYAEEHIPGATHCPVRALDTAGAEQAGGADKVILYCLKDFRGYEGVRRMLRHNPNAQLIQGFGLTKWKANGFPTAGEFAKVGDKRAMELLRTKVE